MKKIFLGLGLLSIAALTACGGSSKDKKATFDQLADDTDLTAYTLTTGQTILENVNKTNLYNSVSIGFIYTYSYDGQERISSGSYSYEYNSNLSMWQYDAFNSQTSIYMSYDDVKSYNNGKFDGFYSEYQSYSSLVGSYTTVNWYTKNDGGYRNVALMNKDDITARIIVDWDSNGYRTTTTALHYDIDSEGKLTMKDVKLTYSYSNMQ